MTLKPLPVLIPPPRMHNYLLVFSDGGRGPIYLTVWANNADEATAMALQIEASIECPFQWDCLKLSADNN